MIFKAKTNYPSPLSGQKQENKKVKIILGLFVPEGYAEKNIAKKNVSSLLPCYSGEFTRLNSDAGENTMVSRKLKTMLVCVILFGVNQQKETIIETIIASMF